MSPASLMEGTRQSGHGTERYFPQKSHLEGTSVRGVVNYIQALESEEFGRTAEKKRRDLKTRDR